MKYQIFLISIIIQLGLGCNSDQLSPKGMVEYTEDPRNGLRVEKDTNNFKFQAQYKPLDYIIAMEERKPSLPYELVEKRKMELGDEMDYYSFRIGPSKHGKNVWSYINDVGDKQIGQELTYYLSYEARKDFYLLDGADTLNCKLFQFVNTAGLSPYIDFVLGFEKRRGTDRLLVYNDQFSKTGPVEFRINKENIHKIPALKTK